MSAENPVQNLANQMARTSLNDNSSNTKNRSNNPRQQGGTSQQWQQAGANKRDNRQYREATNSNSASNPNYANQRSSNRSNQSNYSSGGRRGGHQGGQNRGNRHGGHQSYLDLASAPTSDHAIVPEELKKQFEESQEQHNAESAVNNSANGGESRTETSAEADNDWKSKLNLPPRDDREKTEDVTRRKGLEFEDFHLRRDLLKGIFEIGFESPSPIQEEAIPIALMGRHILARAKNGTGKVEYIPIVIQSLSTAHFLPKLTGIAHVCTFSDAM
jgi:hypothetical protein